MPKAASSTVITYRIELQDTERRLLQQFIDAYTLEQVSTPVVEILKDASAHYAVVTMIELFTDIDLPILTAADTGEIWNAIKDAVRARQSIHEDEPLHQSVPLTVVDFLLRFLGLTNPEAHPSSPFWVPTPNPAATNPDWNEGVPIGPVQASGEF